MPVRANSAPGSEDRGYCAIGVPGAEAHAAADLLPPAAETPRPRKKVAVLAVHGMGQPVRFETLDGVTRILRTRAIQDGNRGEVKLERVQWGDEELTRARLTLHGAEGEREVHVYEAYWAPLTEGRVTLSETVGFLLRAGVAGLQNGVYRGQYERWMFGRWIGFGIQRRVIGYFVLALMVVLSLVVINAAIVAVSGAAAFLGPVSKWPTEALLGDLTADFAVLVGVALCAGLSLWSFHQRGLNRASLHYRVSWFLVWLTVGAAILVAGLTAWHLVLHHSGDREMSWRFLDLSRLTSGPWAAAHPQLTSLVVLLVRSLGALIWMLIIAGSLGARWFILQYVGDVAVYVSAHTVNRFYETRQAIQEACLKVARGVYEASSGADEFEYSDIVVVGHSLGAVIAYDTLNALINEAALSGKPLEVASRTRLFLTLGCPLDKTAFIFRSQRPRDAEVREVAAATVQPMISSYAHRPERWVNIYSPDDWIAGSLQYYDDTDLTAHASQFVINLSDDDACTPVAAHSEYWTKSLFIRTLYDAVTR
jgi:hypothetical protein